MSSLGGDLTTTTHHHKDEITDLRWLSHIVIHHKTKPVDVNRVFHRIVLCFALTLLYSCSASSVYNEITFISHRSHHIVIIIKKRRKKKKIMLKSFWHLVKYKKKNMLDVLTLTTSLRLKFEKRGKNPEKLKKTKRVGNEGLQRTHERSVRGFVDIDSSSAILLMVETTTSELR